MPREILARAGTLRVGADASRFAEQGVPPDRRGKTLAPRNTRTKYTVPGIFVRLRVVTFQTSIEIGN